MKARTTEVLGPLGACLDALGISFEDAGRHRINRRVMVLEEKPKDGDKWVPRAPVSSTEGGSGISYLNVAVSDDDLGSRWRMLGPWNGDPRLVKDRGTRLIGVENTDALLGPALLGFATAQDFGGSSEETEILEPWDPNVLGED